MTQPEQTFESVSGPVSYDSFDAIQEDPKKEGLRPGKRYAGGNEGDIVIVAGVRYMKVSACEVVIPGEKGDTYRPYTEREYYSHETPKVGPGPEWDSRVGYLEEGWGITDLDATRLSDFPLFKLEQEESPVDRARQMIASAPARVEREFQQSKDGESWMECFEHRVDAVEEYLFNRRTIKELPQTQWEEAKRRLQTLKQRMRAVSQYPERNTVPSDDMKQELFSLLDIFK